MKKIMTIKYKHAADAVYQWLKLDNAQTINCFFKHVRDLQYQVTNANYSGSSPELMHWT